MLVVVPALPLNDQNFLKKIPIQTIIKMSLKFHCELQFLISFKKLYSYYFVTEILFICVPLGLLKGVHFTSYRIFDLQPCSDHVLFVSRGVPVTSWTAWRWLQPKHVAGGNVKKKVCRCAYSICVYVYLVASQWDATVKFDRVYSYSAFCMILRINGINWLGFVM
jgi:hypothetical protein